MVKAPSLISLAAQAVKRELLLGDDVIPYVYELLADFFDILLTYLPPLALQKLRTKMPFKEWKTVDLLIVALKMGEHVEDMGTSIQCGRNYLRRVGRGSLIKLNQLICSNCIGKHMYRDTILKYIGYEQQMNHSACDYSKLSYHCQQFGHYARCLRLRNALCVEETCVQALCKLLIQNSQTLASLEFHHCKLSSSFVEGICCSLCNKRKRTHKIENLSINISRFIENSLSSVASFLSSGRYVFSNFRLHSCLICDLIGQISPKYLLFPILSFAFWSLCSLKLRHCHLDGDFGRMVFCSLLEASSCLSILDLSGNSIGGWLSNYDTSGPLFSLGGGKSLQSLRLLNLSKNRGGVETANFLSKLMPWLQNLLKLMLDLISCH